jgi:hypothetical protein
MNIFIAGASGYIGGSIACAAIDVGAWLRDHGLRTAILRQINTDRVAAHRDALEFPNGEIVC